MNFRRQRPLTARETIEQRIGPAERAEYDIRERLLEALSQKEPAGVRGALQVQEEPGNIQLEEQAHGGASLEGPAQRLQILAELGDWVFRRDDPQQLFQLGEIEFPHFF